MKNPWKISDCDCTIIKTGSLLWKGIYFCKALSCSRRGKTTGVLYQLLEFKLLKENSQFLISFFFPRYCCVQRLVFFFLEGSRFVSNKNLRKTRKGNILEKIQTKRFTFSLMKTLVIIFQLCDCCLSRFFIYLKCVYLQDPVLVFFFLLLGAQKICNLFHWLIWPN